MKFSIIIPTYNVEKYISNSLQSVINQTYKNIEILIIDDCSSDNTLNIVKNIQDKRIKIFTTNSNSGPGIARNLGIEKATGDWILFVDADDELELSAIDNLYTFIKNNNVRDEDIIAFNWKYNIKSQKNNKFEGRYDFKSLVKTKNELIKDFISLAMDGSVIYTLYPTSFIKKNKIKFENGFHEDIYFIFQVYINAKKIFIFNKKLYKKFNRKGSIINSISKKHIDGYFNSFFQMHDFLVNKKLMNEEIKQYFIIGIINAIAIEIQNIWLNSDNNLIKLQLYEYLYKKIQELEIEFQFDLIQQIYYLNKKTKYFMIVKYFITNIKNKNLVVLLDTFLANIANKSFSCYDLHNSLFLSYSEIRTCCKRFFDNGKMKGDVVLIDSKKENITLENILQAKQDLYNRINRDEAEECRNCPFLEFKEWGRINELKIKHLSLEYHSLCNMKCIYCSEAYYGGEKADYNVFSLLKDLYLNKALDNIQSIVWGGGEPTLDKNFLKLLEFITNNFPNIKIRIITNATKYFPKISELLAKNKVAITTSIDAGTEETFFKVRNNKDFFKVLSNLKKYSKYDLYRNITLKYIFLNENNDIENVINFVELIVKNNLINCNFQLSYDFKKNEVDINSIISAVIMFGLLKKNGVEIIFLDDLFRQRLIIDDYKYNFIYNELKKKEYDKFLFNPEKYKEVVIWGAGVQTRQLLNNSYLLKKVKIVYIVDDFISKNTKFFGYNVYNSSKLINDKYPIIISASQNTPEIMKRFETLGISKNRLIKELIL